MERLNTEMAERKMDLDIEYSDKEKAVTEELEKIKLDAENE
jgi:phage host-nuclease inhibitor protein Gam